MVTVELNTLALQNNVQVLKVSTLLPLNGRGDFLFEVSLLLKTLIRPEDLFEQSFCLNITPCVSLRGYVKSIHRFQPSLQGWQIDLSFASHLHRLKTKTHATVFTKISLYEIFQKKLSQHFLPHQFFISDSTQSYLEKFIIPFEAQKSESDFNFLMRLVERFGLFLIWNFEDNHEQLCLRHELPAHSNHCMDHPELVLKQTFRIMPYSKLADYDPLNPKTPSVVQDTENNPFQFGETYEFGTGYSDVRLLTQLAAIRSKAIKAQTRTIEAQAKNPPEYLLQLGSGLTLQEEKFKVIAIHFECDQSHALLVSCTSQDVHFFKLELAPQDRDHHLELSHELWTEPNQYAHVQSQDEHSVLDQAGRYTFKYDFKHLAVGPQNSPPTHALQNLADQHSNMHHPHPASSKLVVGHYHGLLSSPVILGAVLETNAQSAVNDRNPSEHRFLSKTGHGWTLDDQHRAEHITFHTLNHCNSISLSNAAMKPGVFVTTQAGIQLHSAADWQQCAGNDFLIEARKNLDANIRGNGHVLIGRSALWRSKTAHLFSAQNMRFQSQSLNFICKKLAIQNFNTQFIAQENWRLRCQKHFFLKAHRKLMLSTKSGSIKISNAGSSLVINNQGIFISSPVEIQIEGAASLQLHYKRQDRTTVS